MMQSEDLRAVLDESDLRAIVEGRVPDLAACAARPLRDGLPVSLGVGDRRLLAEGRIPQWLRGRAIEAVETGLLAVRVGMSVRAKAGTRVAKGVGLVFALCDGTASVGYPDGTTWSCEPAAIEPVRDASG